MSIDMLSKNDQKKLKNHIKSEQLKATHKREWLCKTPFIGHNNYVVGETGFIMTKTLYLVCHRCGRFETYTPCNPY